MTWKPQDNQVRITAESLANGKEGYKILFSSDASKMTKMGYPSFLLTYKMLLRFFCRFVQQSGLLFWSPFHNLLVKQLLKLQAMEWSYCASNSYHLMCSVVCVEMDITDVNIDIKGQNQRWSIRYSFLIFVIVTIIFTIMNVNKNTWNGIFNFNSVLYKPTAAVLDSVQFKEIRNCGSEVAAAVQLQQKFLKFKRWIDSKCLKKLYCEETVRCFRCLHVSYITINVFMLAFLKHFGLPSRHKLRNFGLDPLTVV